MIHAFERRPLVLFITILVLNLVLLSVQVRSEQGRFFLRKWSLFFVTPVASAMHFVTNKSEKALSRYVFLRGAQQENQQLRSENAALKVEVEQLSAMQSMAIRSAHYSLLRQQYSFGTLLAGVIWKTSSFHSDHFGINAGARDGLRKGSAVLSPEGIAGRVVTIEPFGAEVEPITGRGSAVGGVLSRSRLQGVLQGDGSELLEWRLIPNHEEVEIGEVVYTSGADRIYPKGLPIGLIVKSERGEMVYRDIRVRPFVDYSRLEEVLVVTTPKRNAEIRLEGSLRR
jgi:rod shape-determining protein MreC